MARPRYKPNPAAVAKIGLSPEMYGMVKGRAEVAAAEAVRVAPVGTSDEGEHYKDQIDTVVVRLNNRWVARVRANKFTSAWIEFGTARGTPIFAPLRKGLMILGLKFKTRSRSGGKLGKIQGGRRG